MESLINGSLGIEGETGVDLSRDLSWDNLQDLLSELDEETVKGGIGLVINRATVLLSVFDGSINELGVLLLLCGGENQGWVGGGILWLVGGNGSEVTRVGDDSLKLLSVYCSRQ